MTKIIPDSHVAILNIKACLGCGRCIDKCPIEAIPHNLIGLFSHLLKIDKSKCTGCGECISFCPHKAIKLVRLT